MSIVETRAEVVNVFIVGDKKGKPLIGFSEAESTHEYVRNNRLPEVWNSTKMIKIWNPNITEWEFFPIGKRLEVHNNLETRIARIRRRGLLKLTTDEKEALGLDDS